MNQTPATALATRPAALGSYNVRNSTLSVVFFFFQAEDGIRDYKVTGVQTCALPILQPCAISDEQLRINRFVTHGLSVVKEGCPRRFARVNPPSREFAIISLKNRQIGRASCRERV